MIVISFVLFLAALGLLVSGVLAVSLGLVLASVAASLLAFVAVFVGVRQRSSPPVADSFGPTDPDDGRWPAVDSSADNRLLPSEVAATEPSGGTTSEHAREAAAGAGDRAGRHPPADYQLPSNEPPVEPTSAADALRVAGREEQVQVVDGRPRYHLTSCAHLVGREPIALPIGVAREAGFTPCGLCAPDRTVLSGG